MLRKVLRTSLCMTGCVALLTVGTAGYAGQLQAASGQADLVIHESYNGEGDMEDVPSGYAEGNTAAVQKISLKSKKGSASSWSDDKKYYFDENGEMVTGIVVIKGEFYCFKSNGKYDKSKTKKIQKAATYEKPFSKLKKYIGKPNKTKYLSSCYGKGKDGILTYDQFKVYTFKPDKGQEIFMGAE